MWPLSMRCVISRRARAPLRVVEPRTTLKPQALDDLGDHFAVGVVGDQDVHFGPGPVVGGEEHDLVEEGVNEALVGVPGELGVQGRVFVAEVEAAGADQAFDHQGACEADGLDGQGVTDLHRADLLVVERAIQDVLTTRRGILPGEVRQGRYFLRRRCCPGGRRWQNGQSKRDRHLTFTAQSLRYGLEPVPVGRPKVRTEQPCEV